MQKKYGTWFYLIKSHRILGLGVSLSAYKDFRGNQGNCPQTELLLEPLMSLLS